jgi:hypothetical protein
MINQTERYVPETDRPGGIWTKWGVDGVTQYGNDLRTADITVTYQMATSSVHHVAMIHERGHVDVLRDIVANVAVDEDAKTVLRSYDKWQGEVEAWVRGLDATAISREHGYFILDCLNTYRRSLAISDDEWYAAKVLIAGYAATADSQADLLNYVPLEPEPGDPPPCGGTEGRDPEDDDPEEGDDDPEDGGDPEDGDDDDDDDDPEDGGDPEDGDDDDDEYEDGGDPEDGDDDDDEYEDGDGDGEGDERNLDRRWTDEAVVRAIEDGATVDEAATRFGLDPAQVPPLIRVLLDMIAESKIGGAR